MLGRLRCGGWAAHPPTQPLEPPTPRVSGATSAYASKHPPGAVGAGQGDCRKWLPSAWTCAHCAGNPLCTKLRSRPSHLPPSASSLATLQFKLMVSGCFTAVFAAALHTTVVTRAPARATRAACIVGGIYSLAACSQELVPGRDAGAGAGAAGHRCQSPVTSIQDGSVSPRPRRTPQVPRPSLHPAPARHLDATAWTGPPRPGRQGLASTCSVSCRSPAPSAAPPAGQHLLHAMLLRCSSGFHEP